MATKLIFFPQKQIKRGKTYNFFHAGSLECIGVNQKNTVKMWSNWWKVLFFDKN